MQFACEQCSTRYAVPDEKVVGKRVRTQCRKCGAQILIEGPSAPPETGAFGAREERLTGSLVKTAPLSGESRRIPTSRATPVARDDSQWTVAFGPDERRKMSTSELVEAYARGQVTEDTLVWKDGMESWQPPFEVPVIAIALQARGLSPDADSPGEGLKLGLESARPPPPAAPPPRKGDSFRATNPATPSSVRGPNSKPPADISSKATVPRRSIPRPPARSVTPPPVTPKLSSPVAGAKPGAFGPSRSLTPGPVPDDAWQDDDEATHALPDKAAPAGGGAASAAPPSGEGPPITVRGAAEPATVEMPPGAALYTGEFEFENETTAVISADKARALLDAEAQRDAAKKPEGRLGFIFDDEATEVIGPERATALLSSDPEAAAAIAAAAAAEAAGAGQTPPPPRPPKLSPYPGTPASRSAPPPPPTPAAGTPPPPQASTSGAPPAPPPKLSPYPQVLPPGVPEPGPEPSVVVRDARRIRPIDDDLTRTLPPKVTRELGGIQHEKTRLVRVVTKKKDSGTSFWVILVIALAAAATGGFLASQMIQRHGAPGWMKSK